MNPLLNAFWQWHITSPFVRTYILRKHFILSFFWSNFLHRPPTDRSGTNFVYVTEMADTNDVFIHDYEVLITNRCSSKTNNPLPEHVSSSFSKGPTITWCCVLQMYKRPFRKISERGRGHLLVKIHIEEKHRMAFQRLDLSVTRSENISWEHHENIFQTLHLRIIHLKLIRYVCNWHDEEPNIIYSTQYHLSNNAAYCSWQIRIILSPYIYVIRITPFPYMK